MNVNVDDALLAAINDSQPVFGLSHTFYKYPARFSPAFVREVITSMTKPGDVVLDPFVGGGTSLVEAMAAGRHGLGLDINHLAVFIAKVKTTIFSDKELARVSAFIDLISTMPLKGEVPKQNARQRIYSLNLGQRSVWRVRSFLALCLNRIQRLDSRAERNLVRCILLRTSQWALDCRKQTPSISQFRERLKLLATEAISGAKELRSVVHDADSLTRTLCVLRSAIGSEVDKRVRQFGSPSLVVTSPPYPGVHILYHRWQVHGRRETAAPYWIANLQDGRGASYYTFADRNRGDSANYLKTAEQAFGSVRNLVARGTPLVQMVAFADPDKQLAPYLKMLAAADWTEMKRPNRNNRPRRLVPGRKWYTSIVKSRANREVVLFHAAR